MPCIVYTRPNIIGSNFQLSLIIVHIRRYISFFTVVSFFSFIVNSPIYSSGFRPIGIKRPIYVIYMNIFWYHDDYVRANIRIYIFFLLYIYIMYTHTFFRISLCIRALLPFEVEHGSLLAHAPAISSQSNVILPCAHPDRPRRWIYDPQWQLEFFNHCRLKISISRKSRNENRIWYRLSFLTYIIYTIHVAWMIHTEIIFGCSILISKYIT